VPCAGAQPQFLASGAIERLIPHPYRNSCRVKDGVPCPPGPAQSTKIAKLISRHGLLESASGLQRLKPRFRHGGHLHDAHGGEMPIDCAWRVSSPTSDFAKVRLLSHATAAAVGIARE
jgi:hypothetical protein